MLNVGAARPKTANAAIAAPSPIEIDLSARVYSRTGQNNDACNAQFERVKNTASEISTLTIHPSCLHYLGHIPHLVVRTLIVSEAMSPSQQIYLHLLLRSNLTLLDIRFQASETSSGKMDMYARSIITEALQRNARLKPLLTLIQLLLETDQRSVGFSQDVDSLHALLKNTNKNDLTSLIESKIFGKCIVRLNAVKNDPSLVARKSANNILQLAQVQAPTATRLTTAAPV